MKKSTKKQRKQTNTILSIIVVIVLILIVGGIAWYLQRSPETQNGTEQDAVETEAPDASAPGPNNERYLEYSEEVFANTDGRRLLFFHAPWCPQCRALEADIKENTVPEDVTIFETDYDTETELKEEYDVTIQTTVVEVDADGNEIAKVVPYDEPTLEYVLRELDE